jgi:hypothetical protein
MNEMAHLWHSCLGHPTEWEGEDDERPSAHRREAKKAFTDIGRLLLPWYKRWRIDEGTELVDLWKAFKEREKDPEYAKELKRDRAKVNRLAQEYKDRIVTADEIREARKAQQAELERKKQERKRRRGLRRPVR